ncbi:nucleotide-diphospho-sugar transferase [Mycena floridula]|nr:nucleotide-diphospho-sugar transferase [Mycena floridula]
MAPNAGKEKLTDDDAEVLQAVILADSFNKRFRPLTTRKPRCLLPICNAPLLDWTFESLALAGVQEIFVICRSHADQVKATIASSRWAKPGSGIKIVPIQTAKETFSPGDAMRDIYTRGLVTSDFVLVMGDLVSNIAIDEVVRVHKERRKTNKDAIMTVVVKESGGTHRTKSTGDSGVFVLDKDTAELVHYAPVLGYPATKKLSIPREVLEAHPELEIRNDLIDCCIDVCSVEVPSLFQDNFDYLDIRKDFVHGILTSDLLMKNIHCYVAKEGYAARVKDTKSYESISKDILSRWTFPLVPDDNHPGDQIYEHLRGNRYIAKDNTVILARTSKVGQNTLIGSSTKVDSDAQILSSVIGRDCIIGANTVIRDAYIFEGTVIGAGCIVEQSIVGANVKIGDGSRIPKGCLIGDGVVLGPKAMLEQFERLSRRSEDEDEDEGEDSDLEDVEANQGTIVSNLGAGSNAIVWPRGPPDEDDDEDGIESYRNQRFMRLGDNPSDVETDTNTSESESDSDDDESESGASPSSSSTSLPLPTTPMSAGGMMAEREFQTEVQQSLARAFTEGHSVDNAAVELKTLRMASNVPLSRVRESVIAAIVDRIKIVDGAGPQRNEISSVIQRWGSLIDKIGGVDAVETISMLQTHCASSSEKMPMFVQILAALYQDDLVEDDDIRAWYALPSSKGEGTGPLKDNVVKCWEFGGKMIQHLDEQDESDDSDPKKSSEEDGSEEGSAEEESSAEEEEGLEDESDEDD